MKDHARILFFGTPEFAVASLDALINAGLHVAGVVTAPDREAGRGMKITSSPVKQFALNRGLTLFQPEDLSDRRFHEDLVSLGADLQVVVAFRLLPGEVWSQPPLGTFNLHASLLPQYRGAAPINWAIINGETKTGVTTFFIDDKIDTGNIIDSMETDIGPSETAGELHDRLKTIGAGLVVETAGSIISGRVNRVSQSHLLSAGMILKKAPKILKEHCRINWDLKVGDIFNLIRGLSPLPGAYTTISLPDGSTHYMKVYRAETEVCAHAVQPGGIVTDGRTFFKIAASDGFIHLTELQLAGKKTMLAVDFLRGFGRHFF